MLTQLGLLRLSSTVLYEVVDAALRHPAILPTVWGPGWKGWDAQKSVSENVNGKWGGCGYFDVMWTFAWLLKSEKSFSLSLWNGQVLT